MKTTRTRKTQRGANTNAGSTAGATFSPDATTPFDNGCGCIEPEPPPAGS